MPRPSAVLAELKRLAAEPDPLDLIRRHAAQAPGPWPSWTLERQVWFLRKKARLSQKELALKAGVTQARICRIEAGADPKWSTVAKLFAALGYDPLVLPAPAGRRPEGRRFEP